MTLFGSIGGGNPLDRTFNEQEAVSAILLGMAAIDGDISDDEVSLFNYI